MRPWHLGNTTVRSALRLRDGLIAISESSLHGNLRGEEQEKALRVLLGRCEIVSLGEDISYSVGRKWRSALNKMGFLYPLVKPSMGFQQSDLGPVDTITPNGRLLIQANTLPAIQEVYLRSLAAYFIYPPVESDYAVLPFSPLRHTLAVMKSLELATGSSRLNINEMEAVVILTGSDDNIEAIAGEILHLRKRRGEAVNKKKFDNDERKRLAVIHKYQSSTFRDYADTNFRYIRSTGLIRNQGKGIALVEEKKVLIDLLIQENYFPASTFDFYQNLCNGAKLPTDEYSIGKVVLEDLTNRAKVEGIEIAIPFNNLKTAAEVNVERFKVEDLLFKKHEEIYADEQASKWEEISAYMGLLATKRNSATLPNGEEIEVPKSEAPAYFEWILWRAFLAIDSLLNKPYEARRFKVDQDFLPINTAPGNGPDLIFEFEKFILVIEVTLTDNSRQEAAEGEPVRRHVADIVVAQQTKSNKPVYSLFIANNVDSNTAETFRIGVWYTKNDTKLSLDIIPLTLSTFQLFFETLFITKNVDINNISELILECSQFRKKYEAPVWKEKIRETVVNKAQLLKRVN